MKHVVEEGRDRQDPPRGIGAPRRSGPPSQLVIPERRVGHRLVLAPAGEVDIATVDTLREALARAVDSGASDLWLDLTDVAFMDSMGLTALVEARATIDGAPRHFAIICPDGPVRHVLEVAGLDRLAPIHPDRSAANASA